MCRPASCPACGKATYAGCGMHVEQVLQGVPRGQRCSCTPQQGKAATRSLIDRLLRR